MNAPRRALVALVGAPNTGKTTLFNRLTGQRARVGNYPGITVERRAGPMRLPQPGSLPLEPAILDVPGCYSLAARSAEEAIALHAVLGLGGNPAPDLVVVVLDATQLIRSLYLAVQVVELGRPCVLVLNLVDEAGEVPPDPRAVGALLGVPCVATNARSGQGVDGLREAIVAGLQAPHLGSVAVPYPDALEQAVDRVAAWVPEAWAQRADARALARWALTSLDVDDELADVPEALREAALKESGRLDVDGVVAEARYAWLDAHADALHRPPLPRTVTERIDRVLLHPVTGFATFIVLMATIFQALFAWADPAITVIEGAVGWLGDGARAVLPPSLLTDLVVEGVIGGVGNVVVFVPQVALLFLFLGLLEDSGYMARITVLVDRILRAVGLHGRAVVPLLSGMACAVPAIIATRTLERRRDRLLTILVVPLMTCSARLPVYTLVIAALFPATAVLGGLLSLAAVTMLAMYLLGIGMTLVAAFVLSRTVLRGAPVPPILELPPYRWPDAPNLVAMVWQRTRSFLVDAGTIILVATVIMWGLLTFPRFVAPEGMAPEQAAALQLEQSVAGRLGHAIEPAIAPLGLDWKAGVGIVAAFSAREVFVSTMGVVYGIGADVDETSTPLRQRLREDRKPDGRPVWTPLGGLALMVFFAFAAQCLSTLAVIRRETGSWAWPVGLFVAYTLLAWVSAFGVVQVGKALGWG